MCACAHVLNPVELFAAPWTVVQQTPLFMGFPRQEYRSGLLFLPPGDLPSTGIEPTSSAFPSLAGRFFTIVPPGNYYKNNNGFLAVFHSANL